MKRTDDFDSERLGWIKADLDRALTAAAAALREFRSDGDAGHLLPAREEIHRVQGALAMLGDLEGLARVARRCEEALANPTYPPGLELQALIERGLQEIRSYLDDLLAGQVNQTLRLWPVYRDLAQAEGQAAHPVDLFHPALSPLPVVGCDDPAALAEEARAARLKTARLAYQKGLLLWLKKPEEAESGRCQMRAALQEIADCQEPGDERSRWRIATAFLDALGHADVAADPQARGLCSQLDGRIRRLLEGRRNDDGELLRQLLFHIAQVPAASSEAIGAVHRAFALDRLHPADTRMAGPKEASLRRLREILQTAEDDWRRFCSGQAASLGDFAQQILQAAHLSHELGNTDLRRLAQSLTAVVTWLVEAPSRHRDAVAMEVATAILLFQNAQSQFQQLDGEFAVQVDRMVDRLHACIAGRIPVNDGEPPALDEMTRRAQEALLVEQVSRQMHNNLAGIEQMLDQYFRQPTAATDLTPLEAPMRQIAGALTMLGHLPAAAAVQTCLADIRRLDPGQPDPALFSSLAERLSLIGFFVDALPQGEHDFNAFCRRIQGEAAATTLAAPPLPSPPPASPAIDGELLAIFLEEGDSVLGSLQEQAEILRRNPGQRQALTDVRRATHTLKGSGRMVGLHELGETAWALEQAYNHWLAQDLPASPQVQQLLAEQQTLLGAWLAHLRSPQTHPAPDPRPLVRAAEALRGIAPPPDDEEIPTLADVVVAPEPAPSLASEPPVATSPPVPQLENALQLQPAAAEPEDLPGGQPEATPPASPLITEPAQENHAFPRSTVATVEIPPPPAAAPEPLTQTEAPSGQTISISATLYDIFRIEAREHLETLAADHADLLACPLMPTPFEMARAAHTLGGIAATVGLMPLNRLALALERALLRRNQTVVPSCRHSLEILRQAIVTLDDMYVAAGDEELVEQETLIAALDELFPSEFDTVGPAEVPEATEATEATEAIGSEPPLSGEEIDPQLLAIFHEEAAEQLPVLAALLRNWREQPDDPEFPAALARVLHTFKGNARMAGALALGEQAHALESRLEAALCSREPIDTDFFDAFESECDALAIATDALRPEHGPLPPPVAATAPQPENSHALVATLPPEPDEELPQPTAKPPQLALSLLPPEPPPASPTPLPNIAALPSQAPAVQVTAAPVPQPVAAGDNPPEGGEQRNLLLRVKADLVDRLVNEAGELSIARSRIEGEMRNLKSSMLELTDNVIRLRRQLREIEIQAEPQMQARVAQTSESLDDFDPLELDRFTRFQELTRFMAESVNDVATVQQNLLKHLDDANAALLAQSRLNRDLQQELLGMRMLPFASQEERLHRVVRQTARAAGKRARFEIIGGQVEIDRSVLDRMLGPIEHMLRNAVAHGIETAAERQAAGKEAIGEIRLSLAQEGNEIVLVLSDDGHGLDLERIRARAAETGLPQHAGSDAGALYELIFQPGFSTADTLTSDSGRGIGMDVVKTEVSALGGRIEIENHPGQGCQFRIYLPLTLAVTPTVLLRAGTQTYAVPAAMIEQVLELKSGELQEIVQAGEVRWHDKAYPFHYLPHLLGDSQAEAETHRLNWVLLLRSGTQRVAVQIDELKGNQEVVVKNIGEQLARVVGISGATVLGDGRIVLILNPVALAARRPGFNIAAQLAPVEVDHGIDQDAPMVMVVDDSLTVRKILTRLLTREDYTVAQAKDGVDALEQLATPEQIPAVILCDVEMPRMDGFEFLRSLRTDARYQSLPVIMITSRTADKHRQHALELGADAYLGKPYDEAELLRLLAGFCRRSGE